jgi:hypothetical protein
MVGVAVSVIVAGVILTALTDSVGVAVREIVAGVVI